jgi:hypothetical protein
MYKNILHTLRNTPDKSVPILVEEPLPMDWDVKVFDKSYKKRLDYILDRAAKIGSGSSRVAFEIEYEGRPTIIKVAKNVKGLAQNEVEADYGLYRMYRDILIPMIDYDEEHDSPHWIHFEKADKLTLSIFQKIMGFSFVNFGYMLQQEEKDRLGKRGGWTNWGALVSEKDKEKINESELFTDVIDMCGNFEMPVGDYTRLGNWGLYKGSPVIIDMGLNSTVYQSHYERKPKVNRW